MRDRLIELLKEKSCVYTDCENICSSCDNIEMYDDTIESIADYLIANGVIVPPCHIGQTIYQLYRKYNGDSIVRQGKVSAIQQKADKSWKIRITMNSYVFEITPDKIGKTVFLTKEEADKKLEERNGK